MLLKTSNEPPRAYTGYACCLPSVPSRPRRARSEVPAAEDLLGLTLLTGDGLPRDDTAGLAWIARAAEHGDPDAARDISDRLRNGAAIEVDETKIVAALTPRVDAGDVEAMRALGPMIIGGRGAEQNTAKGLGLLKRALPLAPRPANEISRNSICSARPASRPIGTRRSNGSALRRGMATSTPWCRSAISRCIRRSASLRRSAISRRAIAG